MESKSNPKPDIAAILEMNHSRMFKKWIGRCLVIVLVMIVAVVAVTVFNAAGKPNATQFKTEQARRGELTVVVTATGALHPINTVSVGSELSGIIKSVEVDYNDRVKVGQVLARLDTSKLEAQLTQSRAALESAKAKVSQSQATVAETRAKLAQLQKVRELSNGKVPSQSEMDAAAAAFERAKADAAGAAAAVSQAEATLQLNETDLSKSVIRSSINGIVLIRSVEPGQTVAASFETPVLFALAEDLTQMELHVDVDEADVGKVQEGQKATFTVAAYPSRTFEAEITLVRYGSSTTSGVVTYVTVLKVNNSDFCLRPGMTATADIIVKKVENAILIPSAALRFTPPAQHDAKSSTGLLGSLLPHPPGAWLQQRHNATDKKTQQVWVLKNDQLSAASITIGATNGGLTEVVAGDIQPGMAVVVDCVAEGK